MSEIFVENVVTLVSDTDFDSSLIAQVIDQLSIIGIVLEENEYSDVALAIQKVDLQIKNICNVQSLPYGLRNVAVDRVCGEVIYIKYLMKELPENFDAESSIKQLSIGDTTVSYSSDAPDKKVLTLVGFLKSSGEGELLCYRKLTW